MKTVFLALVLMVSCSTKKKDSVNSSDDVGSQKESLVLHGTSDDLKAGGLRTVNFDYQSDRISGDAKKKMDQNLIYLERHPNIMIQIEGHCDERGSAQFNLALGERRAKVVRDYLKTKGISGKRITIVSYGKERPLNDGTSENAMSANRRANFVVNGL